MSVENDRPLRILTWHVHGSYLYYLSHAGHDLYLPVRADGTEPMERLVVDAAHAQALGDAARRTAHERFGIDRFARDWDAVFREAVRAGADAP